MPIFRFDDFQNMFTRYSYSDCCSSILLLIFICKYYKINTSEPRVAWTVQEHRNKALMYMYLE